MFSYERLKGGGKIEITKQDALGLIDMEEDFAFSNGRLFVSGIEGERTIYEVISGQNRLLVSDRFGHTFGTIDQHPPDHVEFGMFGIHCPKDDQGSEIIWQLNRSKINEFLVKGGYRNLLSFSVVTSPDFDAHVSGLRRLGIKRVFLCGLAMNICVIESAVDYSRQGFETIIIRDLARSVPIPNGSMPVHRKLLAYEIKLVGLADIAL